MKRVFILGPLILSVCGNSQAEIWKCQKVGESAPSYTDTPIGGDGINCVKVETIRFTKTGEGQRSIGSSGSRSYAPPPAHIITKVKSKVRSATKTGNSTSKTGVRKSTRSLGSNSN